VDEDPKILVGSLETKGSGGLYLHTTWNGLPLRPGECREAPERPVSNVAKPGKPEGMERET
jgi:hypothetical protein